MSGRISSMFHHMNKIRQQQQAAAAAAAAAAAEQQRKQQEAANVAAGNGYMSNGVYVAYSAPDRAHVQSANANRNSPYEDISTGSQLNRYYGQNSLLGRSASKGLGFASARRYSLLGGFSQLGV